MISRVTTDPITDTILTGYQDGRTRALRAFEDDAATEGLHPNRSDRTLFDLAGLTHTRDVVDDLVDETARAARAAGASWSEVGAALGISKQAAQQRYGRP